MASLPESVCVFCGSRTGSDPDHADQAQTLGRALAEAGIRLVYGGGQVGLMGVLADSVLAAGGQVTGVIPHFLNHREVAHPGLGDLVVVDSMHARKALMVARSQAFVVLPGGLGTLDETFEILTWRQLGLHAKPVVLVDGGFWRPLRALIDHMIAEDFASPNDALTVVDHAREVVPTLAGLAEGAPPTVERL